MAKRKRERRQRGTGTVIQLGPDRYRGAISLGYLPNGKRDRRYVYATTEEGAWQALRELIREYNAGRLPDEPTSMTVGEFLEAWLEDKRNSVSERTWDEYRAVLQLHVIPRIGGGRLDKLQPLRLSRLYRELANDGVGGARIHKAHTVLKQALAQAVRWRYISHSPADDIDAPKLPRPRRKPLTADDARAVITAAQGDRYEALWLLAITTGMRIGELLGLRWPDLRDGYLVVSQTLVERNDGSRYLKEGGKSDASERRIHIPAMAAASLADHRERMAAEGRDIVGGLVFVDTRKGGACRRSNLHRRHWKPILERAGLTDVRPHDLRHTVATLLLEHGSPVHDVQGLLGHSRASVTTDVYGHYRPGRGAETADQISRILAPKPAGDKEQAPKSVH